jgi:hypothetical protein
MQSNTASNSHARPSIKKRQSLFGRSKNKERESTQDEINRMRKIFNFEYEKILRNERITEWLEESRMEQTIPHLSFDDCNQEDEKDAPFSNIKSPEQVSRLTEPLRNDHTFETDQPLGLLDSAGTDSGEIRNRNPFYQSEKLIVILVQTLQTHFSFEQLLTALNSNSFRAKIAS